MKKTYLRPESYVELCDACDMMATSTIDIDLNSEEFTGEGRIRIDVSDIWEEDNIDLKDY